MPCNHSFRSSWSEKQIDDMPNEDLRKKLWQKLLHNRKIKNVVVVPIKIGNL